jgi:tetratricopeptide (TPR) repeat protein
MVPSEKAVEGTIGLHRHRRSDLGWLTRRLLGIAAECSARPGDAFAGAINERLGYRAVTADMLDRWDRGVGQPPVDVWVAGLIVGGADITPLIESLTAGNGPGTLDDMKRRQFMGALAGVVGLAGAGPVDPEPWERLSHVLRRPKRIDAATIDHLERVTVALEQLEPQVSPAALLGPVVGHLDAVGDLLQGEPPQAMRRQLLSLAGETAGLAGWLVWDRADGRAAAGYFRAGLEAAVEAGDSALGAYLMGSAACQPSESERPEWRLRVLEDRSFGFTPSDGTAPTRAWLATLEAEAHALTGDEPRCRAAMERAGTEMRSAADVAGDARPRVTFLDDSYLDGECGLFLARLGHAEEARQYLEPALATLGAERIKTRTRLLTALGAAYANDGEIDEACRLGSKALQLARTQAVQPNLDDIRALRRQLEPWKDAVPVRQLDEQLRLPA